MNQELEHLVQSWEAAELDSGLLEPVAVAAARLAELSREWRGLETDTAGIARRIASGELTLREGIAEHLAESAYDQRASMQTKSSRGLFVREAAIRAVEGIALRALRADSEAFITTLEDEARKIGDETDSIAHVFHEAGVEDASAALAIGGSAAEGWRLLDQLEGRRKTLARAWAVLGRLGVREPGAQSPGGGLFLPAKTLHKIVAAKMEALAQEQVMA